MGYSAGLDVSLEETAICIVDGCGQIAREARVASEPEALATFFERRGVKPRCAPTSRDFRKRLGRSMVARNANAVSGPIISLGVHIRSGAGIGNIHRARMPSHGQFIVLPQAQTSG